MLHTMVCSSKRSTLIFYLSLVLWVQKWKYMFWLQEREDVTQLFSKQLALKSVLKHLPLTHHILLSRSYKTIFLSGKLEMAYSTDRPFSFSFPWVRLLTSSEWGDYESKRTDFPSWELMYVQPTSGSLDILVGSPPCLLLCLVAVFVQSKIRIPFAGNILGCISMWKQGYCTRIKAFDDSYC